MASWTCTGVAAVSGGARAPPPTAPPLMVAPWQGAQLPMKIFCPAERSASSMAGSGMSGPSPSEATKATRSSICSSSKAGSLRTACEPGGPANGILPVRSWKSAEAAPTPIRVGPSGVPSPASPWHEAQAVRNRALPAATGSSCSTAFVARGGWKPTDARTPSLPCDIPAAKRIATGRTSKAASDRWLRTAPNDTGAEERGRSCLRPGSAGGKQPPADEQRREAGHRQHGGPVAVGRLFGEAQRKRDHRDQHGAVQQVQRLARPAAEEQHQPGEGLGDHERDVGDPRQAHGGVATIDDERHDRGQDERTGSDDADHRAQAVEALHRGGGLSPGRGGAGAGRRSPPARAAREANRGRAGRSAAGPSASNRSSVPAAV